MNSCQSGSGLLYSSASGANTLSDPCTPVTHWLLIRRQTRPFPASSPSKCSSGLLVSGKFGLSLTRPLAMIRSMAFSNRLLTPGRAAASRSAWASASPCSSPRVSGSEMGSYASSSSSSSYSTLSLEDIPRAVSFFCTRAFCFLYRLSAHCPIVSRGGFLTSTTRADLSDVPSITASSVGIL